MSNGEVFAAGWSLDDVDWSRFDASKVDAELLAAVKAASLVEYNAHDYVAYLKRVSRRVGGNAGHHRTLGRGGNPARLALGRWAEMADPDFDFKDAFTRFRAGYKPAHFMTGEGSVRGSRRGEMIARCVVESGTSSLYSAIRDASDEPVLKEVAGRIAADEFRHYRLFYEMLLKEDTEPDLPIWRKLWVAMTRINESDDDELSFAYYCGNVAREREKDVPYRRAECSRTHHAQCLPLYRRHHVDKMVKMVLKPTGVNPSGTVSLWASAAVWRVMHMRAGSRRPVQRPNVAKAA